MKALEPEHREKLIQALANLDEVHDAVGQELLEGCKALKPMAKVYEILNGLVKYEEER